MFLASLFTKLVQCLHYASNEVQKLPTIQLKVFVASSVCDMSFFLIFLILDCVQAGENSMKINFTGYVFPLDECERWFEGGTETNKALLFFSLHCD